MPNSINHHKFHIHCSYCTIIPSLISYNPNLFLQFDDLHTSPAPPPPPPTNNKTGSGRFTKMIQHQVKNLGNPRIRGRLTCLCNFEVADNHDVVLGKPGGRAVQ